MTAVKTEIGAKTQAQSAPHTPHSSIPKSNLWDAIKYVYDTVAASIAAHLADAADAHDASAISFTSAGSIAATDVQAAIAELDTEKQPLDADLTAIAALANTDSNFIVGNGSTWVAESGATARASLGLGATDTPEFDGLTISHVTNGVAVGLNTDVDITMFKADVLTGTPTFSWDSSSGAWRSNVGIVFDASGNGDVTHTVAGAAVVSQIELHSEGASALGGLTVHRHSDASGLGGHLLFLKSGGTHASPTVPADQSVIMGIYGGIWDGTDYELAAAMQFYVDGTAANNDAPGGMRLFTNAGTQTLVEWLEVGADQVADFANKPVVGGADILVDTSDIGVTVQGYDADTLKADTADVLTAGFAASPYSGGTITTGTYTPNEANGNKQYITANGAFTLAVPTNACNIELEITNGASAGAITTSSYTKVKGDSYATTNGNKYLFYITKTQTYSCLTIVSLN